MLVFNDLLALATNNDCELAARAAANPELLLVPLRPAHQPRTRTTAEVADGAAAVGKPQPRTRFSTDLSTLLASLGTTVGSDALSAALAEISAQISADLATFVPQSVLSMF